SSSIGLSLPSMLKHSTTKWKGDTSMTGRDEEERDEHSGRRKVEETLITTRPSPPIGRSLDRSSSQESSMYTHTLPRHMGHRMREWNAEDDPLKFSTLQAPKTSSKFQKRKEEQRRRGLMTYEAQGSPYLSGTISRSSIDTTDRSSMLFNGSSSQSDHIIITTRNAYNQLHSFLTEEEERLSTQIEDTNDDARRSGLNQVGQ
uniref:Uncharacterized protein n=1 Tax=Pristionchus pacificus TaxID=54126 RepID=A0A8R1Z846_PRIPA